MFENFSLIIINICEFWWILLDVFNLFKLSSNGLEKNSVYIVCLQEEYDNSNMVKW